MRDMYRRRSYGGLLSFYIATGVFFLSGLDMIPAHLIFIKSADGVAWILTPATHNNKEYNYH
jgi:hypothetical protein